MKASDIKKNQIIRFRDQVCRVRNLQVQLPSSRGSNTLYKVKLMDVATRQNIDHTFKGDDTIEEAELINRPSSYSYFDGEMHVLMDDEDFSQYTFSADDLEGQLDFMSEGMTGILVLIVDDQPVAISLPQTVELEIVECAPAMKGSSVTKRTKTAKLNTGLEVQVPEYLASGEVIKVNTDSGDYISRA